MSSHWDEERFFRDLVIAMRHPRFRGQCVVKALRELRAERGDRFYAG